MKEYSKIIFDVGANDGMSFIPLAKENPDVLVYAFEPVNEMIDQIKNKTKGLNNYILIENAVSNFTGKTDFYVAGQSDWGCSSLLKFSDNSKTKWPGRTDFKVTKIIEVNVIRLDNFITKNNITKIDYLHIDTQGSDLNVLKGLGDYISIVEAGVIEAGNYKDILYDDQNTKEDSVEFLVNTGFIISKIQSNDKFSNEVNIEFIRNKMT